MTPKKPITILLAEDHTFVREGLCTLLKSEAEFEVIAEAANGRKAVELAVKHAPDVVVMDIAMPLLNGLEATKQILKSHPKTKVLILSAHGDDAYIFKSIAMGASGYLLKKTAACVLPVAIRKVFLGLNVFSPEILKKLNHRKQPGERGKAVKPVAIELTSRETEVLQMVAEGRCNKETAAELHISIKTVEKHRQTLMNKLNLHETAGLTRYAIAAGIIESSVQDHHV